MDYMEKFAEEKAMEKLAKEKDKRRFWTPEETVALLTCYKNRKSEMMQPRNKTMGLKNILADLITMNVLASSATVQNIRSKMNSLCRAYHCAIYSEATIGCASSGFQYMELMNAIFRPIHALEIASSPVNAVVRAPSTTGGSKRANWTAGETRALIRCYASREEEGQHPKKGKDLFKNILEDLLSMEVLKAPTTEENVQTKWNSLLNAYKAAHDMEERTGRGRSTFMYMDEMDEIYGDRPIIANLHTINLYGQETEAIPIRRVNKKNVPDEVANDEIDEDPEIPDDDPMLNKKKDIDDLIEVSDDNDDEYDFHDLGCNNTHDIEDNDVTNSSAKYIMLSDDNDLRSFLTENSDEQGKISETTTTDTRENALNVKTLAGSKSIASNNNFPEAFRQYSEQRVDPTTSRKDKTSSQLPVVSLVRTTDTTRKHAPLNVRPTSPATDPHDFRILASVQEIEFEKNEIRGNGGKSKKKSKKAMPNSKSEKQNKPPFSFRRNKTAKEIVQERKERWEQEKLKRKNEAKMELIKFVEEKKQKRHEERCEVMKEILKKL